MSGMGSTTSGVARLRRRLGILLAVLVVAVPIPVGLVLAWQVHWLLVAPAYLLGIPAWLCLVSGTWALVRRALPSEEPVAAPAPTPTVTTELRLPAPRVEGSSAVRTPTP